MSAEHLPVAHYYQTARKRLYERIPAVKIHQLSLFLENKPGHLSAICRTLADARINMLTLTLADTQQFGILRVIVQEWERAQTVLEQAGFVVKVREVVALSVEDRPGGMAELVESLGGSGVNIEYMYAFTARRSGKAVLVFRFDNPDRAIEVLRAAGRDVLGPIELFEGE